MRKTTLTIAAIAAAILALTGCSATPHKTDASPPIASASSSPNGTPSASTPVLTAAPPTTEEETFLIATHRIPGLQSVSMADALKVGHYVCAQLDAGTSPLKITAVKNTAATNNEDMIMVSTLTLCKNHNTSVQAEFIKEHQKQFLANH